MAYPESHGKCRRRLNAYTNKEETVIYSAFLKEHFSRAVELLTDIVFNSIFPEQEITKEVEVIIDEIQSYEDSPAELIFDDFEELIFPNHPLGRNILGSRNNSDTSEARMHFTLLEDITSLPTWYSLFREISISNG